MHRAPEPQGRDVILATVISQASRNRDALSKARYLADIRHEFYEVLPLAEQMKSLAKDIGSRSDYVAQLLTALGLYITAEDAKFFGPSDQRQGCGILLPHDGPRLQKSPNWLGLENKADIEMPGLQEDRLKKAFAWMFSKDQQGRTIIGESRNLDQLAEIVTNDDAVRILEETGRLAEAYLYSEGPQQALTNALTQAQERVKTVWSMLPNTKPLTNEHLELSERLAEDARSIRTYLRDKLED